MYEHWKGKVVHDPPYGFLPQLFAGAPPAPTMGTLKFYLEYAKYEFWKLILSGVTEDGQTLALNIHDFRPYVYLRCAEGTDKFVADLQAQEVEVHIEKQQKWIAPPAPVEGKSDVWKITFPSWYKLQCIVKPKEGQDKSTEAPAARLNFLQFEQLKYELLYMYDRKLAFHGWNSLNLTKAVCARRKLTTCKLEYDCSWDALEPLEEKYQSRIPLQLVVTADIESVAEAACQQFRTDRDMGRWIGYEVWSLFLGAVLPTTIVTPIVLQYGGWMEKPMMPSLYLSPDAKRPRDHCVSIVTHFSYLKDTSPLLSVRHVLGTAEPLPTTAKTDSLTLCFSTEQAMLLNWVHLIRNVFDAELFAGHNFVAYDLPFLYDRAATLGILDPFHRLCRFTISEAQLHPYVATINTKGRGKQSERRLAIPGIRQFDTLHVSKQMFPSLPGYKLEEVVDELIVKNIILKLPAEQIAVQLPHYRKKKLPYEALAPYYAIGPHTRWEIAEYNDQDVVLVDELIRKCGLLDFAIETSADTYTALTDVVVRGQSIRCWNQEASYMHESVLLDHNMRRRLMCILRASMTYEERQAYYDPSFAPDNGYDDPIPYDDPTTTTNAAPHKYKKSSSRKKSSSSSSSQKSYRGARLVEMKRGFYKDFVLTYDFAGLYPSIAITFRLCFTRYLPHRDLYQHDAQLPTSGSFFAGGGKTGLAKALTHKEKTDMAFSAAHIMFPTLPAGTKYRCWFWNDMDISRIRFKIDPRKEMDDDDTYVILVVGCGKERCCFVYEWPRSKGQEVPLPIVCGSCEAAVKRRALTKALLKQAKAEKAVLAVSKYNAQQLCFKCRANSIYGFHGARNGICEFVFISQTICLLGRILNEFTERTLCHKYNRKCVYGDTDSVMPLLTGVSLEEAYNEAIESCAYISSQLPGCLSLEFENIKSPSIFYKPKAYAYYKVWDNDNGRLATGKLCVQGLGNKRRNYSKWFQNTCDLVLEGLMLPKHEGRRLETVIKVVSQAVKQLEDGNVPVADLARSCQVQELKTYKPNQKLAQKNLAERMERRGQKVPGGSRIKFVYTAGSNPLNERAELPEVVIQRRLPLDKAYYRTQLVENVEKLIEFHPDILLAFRQRILQGARSQPITAFFTTAINSNQCQLQQRQ